MAEDKVVRPHWLWFLILDGGILMLVNIVGNRGPYERLREKTSNRLPSYRTAQGLLAGTVVIHAGEAFAAGRIARRKGRRPRPWMVQTFVVGFPSLLELRRA